jgi:plasmid stabilization system protein ParE
VLAIGKKIDMAQHHPRLGPRRPDIREAARLLIEGPYLVLYERTRTLTTALWIGWKWSALWTAAAI